MSEEKWKCPKCGTENVVDDNFCGECGTKKPRVNVLPNEDQKSEWKAEVEDKELDFFTTFKVLLISPFLIPFKIIWSYAKKEGKGKVAKKIFKYLIVLSSIIFGIYCLIALICIFL